MDGFAGDDEMDASWESSCFLNHQVIFSLAPACLFATATLLEGFREGLLSFSNLQDVEMHVSILSLFLPELLGSIEGLLGNPVLC